jgi:hypothetical protein
VKVYFSHSYRDIEVNTYFFEVLIEQGLELFADKKSPTWCVAKLERYANELSGFLSIVPRRATNDGTTSFSPYIGYELSLARRSQLPRLIFVDDEVLNRNRDRFPDDAIPFVRSAPEADRFRHAGAVKDFTEELKRRSSTQARKYRYRSVTMVATETTGIPAVSDILMDVLRDKTYTPQQIKLVRASDAFDDIRILETILNSELCVFLLEQNVSYADVLLAMAYAHCTPCIRLLYDPVAEKDDASPVSGRIRWSRREDVIIAFQNQVDSFRAGFVRAISTQDVRDIAITQRVPRPEQLWDPNDGPALIKHVDISNTYVRNSVSDVRRITPDQSLAGVEPLEICALLYGYIRTKHFAYEHEPPTMSAGRQAIRVADDIWNDNAGTCLDLACLFASLLKAAGLSPVILILAGRNSSHALAGYKAQSAAHWPGRPEIGDLRASIALGELFLFEPTGVAESEAAVGGELAEERRAGNRTLDFDVARSAAQRLMNSVIELRHCFELP